MRQKTNRTLLLVVSIAVLVYLLAFIHGQFSPEIRILPDSHEYLRSAENFKDHGVFYSGSMKAKTDYSLFSRRPPGYPFVLMVLSLVSESLSLAVAFQVLLVFLGGFLLWKINEDAGVPEKLNLAALALYLLIPGQVIYSQIIMAETLLQFLLLLSAYCLMLFLRNKGAIFILGLNLCLGAAVLVKPVMLYFWIPSLVIHLLLFRKTSRKILLLAMLIPLLCSSLWSLRNYGVTGVYHYSSLQVSHMKFYLPGETTLDAESKESFKNEIEETEGMSSRFLHDRDQIKRRLIVSTMNLAAFFVDPGRFDLYQFLSLQQPEVSSYIFFYPVNEWNEYFQAVPAPILLLLALFMAVNLLVLAAFIPYMFVGGNEKLLRLYILIVIFYMGAVVSLAAMGTARYRLSVEPLLIAGAAASAAVAWRLWKNRQPAAIRRRG